MKTWIWGIVACLLFLAGCGGGGRGYFTHFDRSFAVCPVDDDDSMAEELSAKHLDELYAKSGISTRDPSLEAELQKWEHQANFNMPIQMNKQVRAYLTYFSTQRHKIISCQLARSTRYLPMIKGVFQEYGLPEDLAYLAMIESGFNPKARSPAGARGLWQFIKPTGQRYGLVINGRVDERLDPEKSTRAAAKYLRDLYEQFGSWYLAAASYNCGEKRVQRKLSQSHRRNFWELSANQCLPNETKNYVPQMIAAIIIAKNPQKFGFSNVPYQKPVARDRWEMAESRQDTTLAQAGILAGTANVQPRKSGRVAVVQERSRPPSLVPKDRENSGKKVKSPPEEKTRLAHTKGKTHEVRVAQKEHAEPYKGSIFGAPTVKGKHKSSKRVAGKPHNHHKRKSHLHAKAGKGKKRPATHLAQKGGARHPKTKAHKQRSHSQGKGKLAKKRAKKLVLSQAR